MFDEFEKHCIQAFGGFVDNKNQLLSCSSGGIATALSTQIINGGGYVAGVKYTSNFRDVEYYLTNDLNDLNLFKNSKYIDARIDIIYKQIKKILDEGKVVLFVGLPCKVAALKILLKNNYENLITCELICHGPTYKEVHIQFIDYLEKKYKSKIVDFNIRKKYNSWDNVYTFAKFENGKTFIKKYEKTMFRKAFKMYSINRCYNCKFKGNNRVGDIQIGDFWGYDKTKNYYNDCGTSAILVHTDKGLKFLKNNNYISLFTVSFEEVVKSNQSIIHSHKKNKYYDRFKSNFDRKGLKYAIKKMYPINYYIKKLCPKFIKKAIKKLYH